MAAKASFSLTHVEYDEGSVAGFLMAGLTLAPVYVMVMYATLVVVRREIHTLAMLCGQLVNLAINFVLKRLIRQPRPTGTSMGGHGMPSNHAQFIFFFGATASLFFLCRPAGRSETFPGERLALAIGPILFAAAVAYSR